MARWSLCAPQMKGSTLQPASSRVTDVVLSNGGISALEGCQCVGHAGPIPAWKGGTDAVPKPPASQLRELIPNFQHPLLYKEPCNVEVPKPLPGRCSPWLLPLVPAVGGTSIPPLRPAHPCPHPLLRLPAQGCHLLCPNLAKPSGKLISTGYPGLLL